MCSYINRLSVAISLKFRQCDSIIRNYSSSKAWAPPEMFVSGDKPKTFSTQGKKYTLGKKPPTYFFPGGAYTYPCPSCRRP